MKEYPLKVIKGESVYISRGHHDKQMFAEAVEALEEIDVHIEPDEVEHAYYRYVPYGPGDGEYRFTTKLARGHSR